MSVTIASALREGTAALQALSGSPRLDAELLLCHTLGAQRSFLFAHPGRALASADRARYLALIERRKRREPIAYLIGHCEIWNLRLTVDPSVLIPRVETEHVIEAVLEHLPQGGKLLDLGTGSGAIALGVASTRSDAHIIGIDRSASALTVAEHNRQRLGFEHVTFAVGDWSAGIDGTYHVVAANPPYVEETAPEWQLGELRWEPHEALAAGPEGLDAFAVLIPAAAAALHGGGTLIVEHGAKQGSAVQDMMTEAGLHPVETRLDLAGLERVTLGRRS